MTTPAIVARIFLGCPGGLKRLRATFDRVLTEFNKDEASHRGVRFESCGFDDVARGLGRAQSKINRELAKCDYAVFVFFDRWGSKSAKGRRATVGTEEEHNLARKLAAKVDAPMRDLVVLFKNIPYSRIAAAKGDPQLQQVLRFRQRVEREKTSYYGDFDSQRGFERHIRRQLSEWTRELETGKAKACHLPEATPQPAGTGESVARQQRLVGGHKPAKSEVAARVRQLIKAGEFLAAEELLVPGVVSGDVEATSLYGSLLYVQGRLSKAHQIFEKLLTLGRKRKDDRVRAVALGNLGVVASELGRLSEARSLFTRSLKLFEKIGDASGRGDQLGNLYVDSSQRGRFAEAERYLNAAIAAHGEAADHAALAADTRNLGLLALDRGDTENAKHHAQAALRLFEEQGDSKGQGDAHSVLGLANSRLDQLAAAEEHHQAALRAYERAGVESGVASELNSLGLLAIKRGHFFEAEALFSRALVINERLGRLGGVAAQYTNLGLVYQARHQFDKARSAFAHSAVLHHEVGSRVDEASSRANLGQLHLSQGDLPSARRELSRALRVFRALGLHVESAGITRTLGMVALREGKLDEAEQLIKAALVEGGSRSPRLAAVCISGLGNVASARGDFRHSILQYEDARARFEAIGDKNGVAEQLFNLAGAEWKLGKVDRAVSLWCEARGQFLEMGLDEYVKRVEALLTIVGAPIS